MQSVRLVALATACALSLGSPARADTPAAPITASSPDQQIICRKHLETGSLVRKLKRCFTKDEWARISETEQRGTRRMVDELQTRPNMGGGN